MGHKDKGNVEFKNKGFIFVEPLGSSNAMSTARKIARYRGVKEVHLTSGRYGFIVATDSYSDSDLAGLSSKISKATNGKSISVAVSHFVYKRQR